MVKNILNFLKSGKKPVFGAMEKFVMKMALLHTVLFNVPIIIAYHNNLNSTPIETAGYILVSLPVYFITGVLVYLMLVIHRLVFIIFAPVIFVLSGVVAYFIHSFKIVFSPELLNAIYSTDLQEAAEMTSPAMFLWILLLIAVSAWMVLHYRRAGIKVSAYYSIFMLLLFPIMMFSPIGSFGAPLNFISASTNYFMDNYYRRHYTPNKLNVAEIGPVGQSEKITEGLTVVLVLGESSRADHWSLNGYYRETTPNLAKTPGLVNFPHTASCSNGTNVSVACLLTRATRENLKPLDTENSFLSLFRKAGFKVFWVSNNNFVREQNFEVRQVVYNKTDVDKIFSTNSPASGEFTFLERMFKQNRKEKYSFTDSGLLKYLEDLLAGNKGKTFIVLHTVGSHWDYYNRYPQSFEKFSPSCRAGSYSACSRESIINTYDNSILYTDYFLSEVIARLKNRKAVLWYVSDHGELLGERGLWNHLNPDKGPEQYHVPMIWWASDSFNRTSPATRRKIAAKAQSPVSQDNLFHSVPSCASLTSPAIEKGLNLCQ